MSRDRRDGGHRRLLLPVAATALLATGVTSVGVALAGQVAPPAPVAAAVSSPDQAQGATRTGARVWPPNAGPPAVVTEGRQPARVQERTSAAAVDRARGSVVNDRPKATSERVLIPPPVRVRVPSLGIDSPLVALGLTATGQIEAPGDYDRAGWFEKGPSPGEPGAAVIAGHVDSRTGPAVFYHLSALEPGAEIVIEREDGSAANFRVDRVGNYSKDDFPTVEVYATNDRELRLITCGGDFVDGDYEGNVVVFATLIT